MRFTNIHMKSGVVRSLAIAAASVVVLMSAPRSADAEPSILTAWLAANPNSLSDENIAASGSVCTLCHSPTSTKKWNAYGWRIKKFMDAGNSKAQAIQNAGSFDSDLDPTSATNAVEIGADAQPGWTPGANNTIYSSNGNTTPNQMPPAGILGSLDPGLCVGPASSAVYGTGKPGTNGVPTLVSMSPPVLGGMSDLTIGNGLPGATAFLFFGLSQAAIPLDGGTLLLNPLGGPIVLPLNGAGGLSLPVPLPGNAALCGFPAYFQVIFVDPGAAGFMHTAQTAGLAWTLGS